MGVTTVSNSVILGGWVLNNGDKKEGEGWVTTILPVFILKTSLTADELNCF